jgi:uncharacterized protein (TIGR01319 family)
VKIDAVVAEIGSTTTVVSGFGDLEQAARPPRFLAQASAPTSVEEGDVTIGLFSALSQLFDILRQKGELEESSDPRCFWKEFFALSSAAGGLKMSVHGLVLDMTVKAAREAALGAGAIIRLLTAGLIKERDLEEIDRISPRLILLAGGIDYGEEATILANARTLADHFKKSGKAVPVIYAGNCAAAAEASAALRSSGAPVYEAENVYPRLDELNVGPARKIIQNAFETHIVTAPGMENLRNTADGPVLPVPGAVMTAAELLARSRGDLMVFDIGGATTDLHSVTRGSEEIGRILLAPEAEAKRSVEGDLGVYRNRMDVFRRIEEEESGTSPALQEETENLGPLPKNPEERKLVARLAETCATEALLRHSGRIRESYGPTGRIKIAEGKDLTAVQWIIGTGGPLTRLGGGKEVLAGALERAAKGRQGKQLLLPGNARILIDSSYIMAACGVLSLRHPRAALELLEASLWPDHR